MEENNNNSFSNENLANYRRDRLFNNIDFFRVSFGDIINRISKNIDLYSNIMTREEKQVLNFEESKLFNLANVISNKVMEISKTFQEHGLPSFYGCALSGIIENQFLKYATTMMKALEDLVNSVEAAEPKIEQNNEESFSDRVKRFFGIKKPQRNFFDLEKLADINKNYNKCIDIINEVINFDFSANLVEGIIEEISIDYDTYRECIGPVDDMIKEMEILGLGELVPKLEQQLREREYYDALPGSTYFEEKKREHEQALSDYVPTVPDDLVERTKEEIDKMYEDLRNLGLEIPEEPAPLKR